MPVVAGIAELRDRIGAARRQGRRIGFVPTLGALHEGHLRLIDEAKRRTDFVVVSIFVNPLQFGPTEDLARYPRNVPRDTALCAGRGASLVFVPEVATMYPPGADTRVVPGPVASRWEGEVRPGHFAGVLTVVAKLFNLVQPDVAVFGQKDIQQVTLVRGMVRDLDMPIELAVVPTVREPDGLALSSRNVFLSPPERAAALVLSRALRAAADAFRGGERDGAVLRERVAAALGAEPAVKPDYIAVVDAERFEPVSAADAATIVALAARVGGTRLIDNVILGDGLP